MLERPDKPLSRPACAGPYAPALGQERPGAGRFGKWQIFSGSMLKLIAAFSMLLDHISVAWIQEGILKNRKPAWLLSLWKTGTEQGWQDRALVLRCAGRLAFPVFAFFLVEGFCHSKNRKSYGLRLFLFAVITEVIFDLALFGRWFYPGHQNVLFTFLIAFMVMWGMEKSAQDFGRMAFFMAAGCGAAFLLKTDYGAYGVMLVLLLYWYRGNRQQLLAGAVMAAVGGADMWFLPALSFLFLAGYNGKRGKWPGKYFFYLFYPGHLLLLYLLKI